MLEKAECLSDRFRAATVSRWKECFAPGCLSIKLPDRGNQTIAFARNGFDEPGLACIIQNFSQLGYGACKHVLTDERVPPYRADQFFLAYHFARMTGQALKYLHYFWLKPNDL